MRYSVSRSPSPVQRTTRRPTNGYSIHNVSDDDESNSSSSDEDDKDSERAAVLSFSHAGRDTSSLTLSRALARSNPEQTVDNFLTAVRLRSKVDPVEEYQKAERAAVKASSNANPPSSTHLLAQAQTLEQSHAALQAKRNADEMAAVLRSLAQLDMQRAGRDEDGMKRVKEGVRGMWEGIEGAIRRDEEKKRAEEEKRRQEEERKRHEQERERKRVEEKRRAEEEEKRKKAEEERKKKEKEEQEAKRKDEEDKAKKAAQDALDKARSEKERAEKEQAEKAKAASTGRSAMQEWENAWTERAALKNVAKALEENAELRPVAGRLRRKLRTRVGQVTNSLAELEKLADAIHEILSPSSAHPPAVYTSLLSALSKYLLLQSETEVTAKLPTAYPLARLVWLVVARGHDRLLGVFWARFVGRTGGWGVGVHLARKPGMSDTEWRKTIGRELEGKNDPDDKPPTLETTAQYTDRMVGQLALYSALLQTSPLPSSLKADTIPAPFRLPRLWTWLARVLNSPELMSSPSAPQCLGVVLEVAGDRLHEVYGAQFGKLMKAVAEVVQRGIGGEGETGARVRLGLMVERWQREGKFGLEGREAER